MASFLIGTILVAIVALFIRSSRPVPRREPEEIAREEAEALLHKAVALLRAGKVNRFFKEIPSAPEMCRMQFDRAGGPAALPAGAPRIVDRYVLPDRLLGGGSLAPDGRVRAAGGHVLVLEGVDGLGRPYRTEFMVYDTGQLRLRATNAVYWSGYTIGQ